LYVRHLFDREPHAFTPEAALAIPAVGHVVDSKAWHFVDDDTTKVHFVHGAQDAIDIASENCSLQAKGG
jgi:hypothetical protein